MGCGSSVEAGQNNVIQANNEPFQGKLDFGAPTSQPVHQAYTQPPVQSTNVNPFPSAPQQDFSQYQQVSEVQVPVQQHQPEAQFHREQQAPQFHVESRSEQKPPQQVHIESRVETRPPQQSYTESKEGKPVQSFGESRGERAYVAEGEAREGRSHAEGKPAQSFGESRGEANIHRESRGEEKPPQFSESREGKPVQSYGEARVEANIHGETRGEQGYVVQSESRERPARVQEQQVTRQEAQQENGEKPAVHLDTRDFENTRETEYGVTYKTGDVSKVLKSLDVEANEAKGHIAEIDAKIRRENTYLKEVSVTFQSDETENMDYFISGLLKTASYNAIFMLLNSMTNFSSKGLQGYSEAIATSSPLEKFSIMQCHNDATDSFFATVLPGVKNNNKSLKMFKIEFADSPELTDETLKYYKEAIEGNTVLEHAGAFFGKSKMTDQAIVHLKNALKNKPNLESLNFGFMEMPQLTDACLQSFKEMLGSLPKLKRLLLILIGAKFSEEAADKFETYIRSLPIESVEFMWKEPVYEEMSG